MAGHRVGPEKVAEECARSLHLRPLGVGFVAWIADRHQNTRSHRAWTLLSARLDSTPPGSSGPSDTVLYLRMLRRLALLFSIPRSKLKRGREKSVCAVYSLLVSSRSALVVSAGSRARSFRSAQDRLQILDGPRITGRPRPDAINPAASRHFSPGARTLRCCHISMNSVRE